MDSWSPQASDPIELLRSMSGDWQSLQRELTQQEALNVGVLVTAGLVEHRFGVEVESIENPLCTLSLNIVAAGELGSQVDQLMQRTINSLMPPNMHFNVRRKLDAIKRTAWGLDCVQNGWPPFQGMLAPPAVRVCDVCRQVPQSPGDSGDQAQAFPVVAADKAPKSAAAVQIRPTVSTEGGNVPPKKARMSSSDVDAKVVNYLLRHHEYDEGSVGNTEPAEQKAISEATCVPEPTISGRFKKWFGGRDGYVAKCRSGSLGQVLQRILDEASSWQGSDVIEKREGARGPDDK